MSKKSSQLTSYRRVRPGEGAVIEGQRTVTPGTDGTTTLTVAVDLSNAPVPDRKYVADCANVIDDGVGFQLCFGQRRLGDKEELRSLIVIHIDYGAIANFLKSNKNFCEKIKQYTTEAKLRNMQLFDIKKEPSQTVALTANIIGASYAGRDACVDLYHASPFVVSELKKGSLFAADPVVRVSMNTALLLAVFERIETLGSNLPESVTEES